MKTASFEIPFDQFREKFVGNLKDKIVVVSIFGKSSLLNFGYKQSIFSDLFSYHFNFTEDHQKLDKEAFCNIECQYDEIEKVLYMNLRGSFDTSTLLHVFKNFTSELKTDGFLAVWSRLKNHYARAIMFLFSVSHIILMVHPSHCLDLNSINLLKAMSYVRHKYQGGVSFLLKSLPGTNKEWAQQGRLASPRLLFLFTNSPSDILQEDEEEKMKRVKKLERSLEDQIYRTLRKVHLVKNICDHACFSIAPNNRFVYSCLDDSRLSDYYSSLLSSVIQDCNFEESSDEEQCAEGESFEESEEGFGPNPFALLGFRVEENNYECGEQSSMKKKDENMFRHSLQDFILEHVRTAHRKGFYDNMVKCELTRSYLELPTFEEWFVGINAIITDQELGMGTANKGSASCLEKILSKELRFSSSRCSKVYPLAILAYKENLPQHYGGKVHKQKVDLAVSVFLRQARGPEAHKFVDKLKTECDRYWKAGRQSKEAINSQKNGGIENEQWSSTRYGSVCTCCCMQQNKMDALSARAAELGSKECLCSHIEKDYLKVKPRKVKPTERKSLEVL